MRCFSIVLGVLVLTSLCSSLLPLPLQQRFLVEFRGLYESFRVAELEDSLSYLLSTTPADAQAMVSGIEYVVRDSNFEGQPACGWLSLPNATIACAVANRCGALRSMVNVLIDPHEQLEMLACYQLVIGSECCDVLAAVVSVSQRHVIYHHVIGSIPVLFA